MFKSTFGRVLSLFASLTDGFSDAASTGSSLLVSNSSTAISNSVGDLASAYSVGGFCGLISAVTTFCFQGGVIRKRFSDSPQNDDEIDEAEVERFLDIKPSMTRKSAYLAMKYSYVGSTIFVNYLWLTLLYSASKAWVQDFKGEGESALTNVTPPESMALILYYVTFDLPFMLTSETTQTCVEMRHLFRIHQDSASDKVIIDKLNALLAPLGRSNHLRKTIRITGSIADTIEHLLPLGLLIPPGWLLSFAKDFPIPFALAGTGVSLALLAIAGTILIQSYWFEGKFSEKNLMALAKEEYAEPRAFIPPKFAKILYYFLAMGGVLGGVDTALSIYLTLRELEAPNYVVAGASFFAFAVAWMAKHYSEVKESQASLIELTNDMKRAYDDIDDPDYPVPLIEYRGPFN